MSLPAHARRRWGLDEGGDLSYVDLGDGLLLLPGGAAALRRSLLDAVSDEDWDAARQGFGDPDLATE